jgi:putative DNA primase/helicase
LLNKIFIFKHFSVLLNLVIYCCFQAANNASDLVGGGVLPPPFSEDEKSTLTDNEKPKRKYTDWDDFRQLRGLEHVKQILLNEIGKLSFENIKVTLQPIAEHKNKTAKLNSALPPGFMLNKEGLYFNKGGFDDDENYIRLSSPIRVLGYTHDTGNENWGILVEFKDRREESKRFAIPCDMVNTNFNEVIGIMTNLGLPYANTRGLAGEQLKIYLSTNPVNNFVCCVDQVGWFISAEHKSFVLPDRVIGYDSEKVVLQSRSPIGCGFNQKNDLTDWQKNIGLFCKGNSRLLFSVSCAFAAPLLRLVGLEGGGFHLGGSSSDGKTTCLMVASSVCSSPDFLESWRATGNALEATASLHNDCLLPLDEIKQANCKDVGETAYMLANGQGKARANKQGDLRQRKSWLLIALSTGELGFDEMLREANQEAYAGIEVRFPEIPSNTGKYGAFENLHNFDSAKAFADHIRAQVHTYYGAPLTAFLENLTADIDNYVISAQQEMKAISNQLCESGMGSQVSRVADRFAIVAAAGELATLLGVTTWSKGDAIWGVSQCFKGWLDTRGHTGNKEGVKALKHVKDYLFKNLNSRFADFTSPDSTIINLVGWKQLEPTLDEDGDDDSRLLLKIPSSDWQDIAKGAGMRAVDLAKLCIEHGIMLKPNGKGLQFNSKLPGMGSVKHYRILATNTLG